MDFKEALEAINTTSSNVEGVKKRFGITRRKVPAGFIQTDYATDQYSDEDEEKPKKKKKKKQRKDEGRKITRNDRPMYTGDWHRDFFKKGDNIEDEDDESKKDEEKLKELLMQVSGARDQMNMDSFWDKGKKYDKNGNEIEPEDGEEDPEKEKNDVDETIGVTNWVDPHYSEKAQDPFWKKGRKHKRDTEEDDTEEDDTEEDDE